MQEHLCLVEERLGVGAALTQKDRAVSVLWGGEFVDLAERVRAIR